ncbi:accessory Sec system protein Asp2 [Arthrobacter sp. YC-RL1]|uniref:accessory Sec system protein Asp2 n=1 Tax=Arthrobacter sp. YC-RL1 TaxID=1652545 RepID=UPI000AC22D59|nr:accessory Sec system protein Asp2 [Arthrobacter sp. YC-RL1]
MSEISYQQVGTTRIGFRQQEAKSDRNHLVVVFSGFRKHGTFDFGGGILNTFPSHIIWIDDTFNKKYSYYMLANGGEDISHDINEFIMQKLQSLGLDKKQCTLAGFSKGGSAALYYGVKFGYQNIVTSVPQFNISKYVRDNWASECDAMFGGKDGAIYKKYENIISNIMNGDEDINKNIYLFTSPSDIQYETEIIPNLHLFEKYTNFNLVTSETPLVSQHDEVTRYNIPLILSVLNFLSEGIYPAFGQVLNGSKSFSAPNNAVLGLPNIEPIPTGEISKISVSDSKLYIEGFGFFRNKSVSRYGEISYNLKLKSKQDEFTVRLGQDKDRLLSSRQFSGKYVDYSHARFATMRHLGIDLKSLPDGRYDIEVETVAEDYNGTISDFASGISPKNFIERDATFRIVQSGVKFVLIKDSFAIKSRMNTYFKLESMAVDQSKIYLQGYFIPTGFQFGTWRSISYYLRLVNIEDNRTFLFKLASANRDDACALSGDIYLDQSKAYFATPGYSGIDISSVTVGEYNIQLVADFSGGIIFSKMLGNLRVSFAETHDKVSVAVVGSCVSRDIFNSSLNPGWRNYADLIDSFYQMSIMSMMANPSSIPSSTFGDLNEHDLSITKKDLNKEFLTTISESKPSFVLFDLFADARFDVIDLGDSLITENMWKIGSSANFSSLDGYPRISPLVNEDDYFKVFEQTCVKLRNWIKLNIPDSTIILNSCRNARQWLGLTEFGEFNAESVDTQNNRWDMLERIFVSVLNPAVIELSRPSTLADPVHPWGLGPVHFESGFYHDLAAELYEKYYPDKTKTHSFELTVFDDIGA